MKTGNFLALICVIAMASGCTPSPLVPVTYDKEVVAKSDFAAFVELNTGRTTGHSSSTMVHAGDIFVPVNTGPNPYLQFRAEDQAIFVENLKSEMQRLEIVGSVSDTASEDALAVVVNFVQTEHIPNFHQYILTISMLLAYGDQTNSNRYEVLSSEGDSTWEKWNTSASKGKKKAATKLLDLLLADIQDFILQIKELEIARQSKI